MNTLSYEEFLQKKILVASESGLQIDKSQVNSILKPHQRDIVIWALNGGKRAIFAAFGLGKTLIQLEICRIINEIEGGRQLIILPLGVKQEFFIDADKLKINLHFIKRTEHVKGDGIYITNYESVRDGKLDTNLFNTVSLDEASVLRSYGSKTYQSFLIIFSSCKYRFVATATPSPNKYKELIHYAGFLGIMDTGQALTRFFKRDPKKANNLTLYPHMEKEFWTWMYSWATFLQKPSDLGYSDDGYILPDLIVHEHMVSSKKRIYEDKDGQLNMFADASLDLKTASREKRDSIDIRINKMIEIINSNRNDNIVIWHDQEKERHAIKKALPEAVEIYGSQDLDTRENNIINFSNGKIKYLATKPILSGSGCNFQRHCHRAIFLGIGFKFNDFIQAIHRIVRYLQTEQCEIHLIFTDTEINILKTLMRKWKNHKEMVKKMTELIQKFGLSHKEMANELKRSIGVNRIEETGKRYIVSNNDAVYETKLIESNSIGLIHTSIPFGNHYEYSASYNDFGHNKDTEVFFEQMDYLTPDLLRVLMPGRVAAIHVKDRVLFGNVTGYGMPSIEPFHCECIKHYMKHGFIYFGMITVVTDVVHENNQTYRLGWSEQCKDGSKMGVGCPEYVLLFRKLPTDTSRGYSDEPIIKSKEDIVYKCQNCGITHKSIFDVKLFAGEDDFKCFKCNNCLHVNKIKIDTSNYYSRSRWQIDAHAFWRSSGDRLLNADEMSKYPVDVLSTLYTEFSLHHIYDYEHHVKVGENLDLRGCLPSKFMTLAPGSHNDEVWHDVLRMKTLNSEQSKHNQNNHICPLQFDIVDRIINRYTNKDETVFDPFGGLFTVPYRSILLGRKARSCELSLEYFFDGVKYLRAAEVKFNMPSLFDFEKLEKGQLIEND